MTNHSRVPSSLYEMTSDRIASSLARPPALRITCASPSTSPANLAGSRRPSMQVRIAKCRAGGHGELCFIAKVGGVFLVGCRHFLKNAADIGSFFLRIDEQFGLSREEKPTPVDSQDFGSESYRISRQRTVRVWRQLQEQQNRKHEYMMNWRRMIVRWRSGSQATQAHTNPPSGCPV